MTLHPLRFHFGSHLNGTPALYAPFAVQLISHLNVVLSETGRQFTFNGIDGAGLPGPNTDPHILPDDCAVDLYFYPPHATQSGTWDVGSDGGIIIHIPLSSLWLSPSPHGFEEYVTALAKFEHEWSHSRGCRGEGYHLHNADPPEGIPLPPVNNRAYPHDIYWTAARRAQLIDPFFTTRPIGHFAFAGEQQDLAWVLKNVRPCAGTASIIRGPYRKGPPWNKTVRVLAPPGSTMRAWAVPGNYRDPWYESVRTLSLDGFVWDDHTHGYPFMGIRVDGETHQACVGYISIWELEWLAIAGIDPVVTCDVATGTISMPQLPTPPRRPPWEQDPRWPGAPWWRKPWIIASWIRGNPGVSS